VNVSEKTQAIIDDNLAYTAHNYKVLPVALTKGRGLFVWDIDNKRYYDFLSGYSSTNQGHCHPKLVKAFTEQAKKFTQPSRAFYNEHLGETSKYLTKLLGYDKFLPMNTGCEAAETAVKVARRWGYVNKKIPDN